MKKTSQGLKPTDVKDFSNAGRAKPLSKTKRKKPRRLQLKGLAKWLLKMIAALVNEIYMLLS